MRAGEQRELGVVKMKSERNTNAIKSTFNRMEGASERKKQPV